MNLENKKPAPSLALVIAEDDEDDYMLTKEALLQAALGHNVTAWVRNGEELLDFLYKRGLYKERADHAEALLILLDLNMPKMDGREALKVIKSDPKLRGIPIVVLTTSCSDIDVANAYNHGVCSYIRKPARYSDLVETLSLFKKYWLELVELPPLRTLGGSQAFAGD